VAEALKVLGPKRRSRRRLSVRASSGQFPGPPGGRRPEFGELPRDPGVYLFRDDGGRILYVGKSVSIRNRARAHFAPSAGPAGWTNHASVVDYRTTNSELGALVLENRLIKELAPPGNKRLTGRDDRLVYIRCRLDIPFPILEVAPDPAPGHAVTIGPMHGRRLALELIEQLDSLFGLRHCGRKLPRRDHPSAYGQMGRCLSPCLGDLDPNLYRRRLDQVLRLFLEPGGEEPGAPLLAHVAGQMRAAAAAQRYERAAALRRRHTRLRRILGRLGGVLEATHARPRLFVAAHPTQARGDAFWLAGGRLVDSGPVTPADAKALVERTELARLRAGRLGELGAHVPVTEIDEVRIVGAWLAGHRDTVQLDLEPPPDRAALEALLRDALTPRPSEDNSAAESEDSALERELDHDRADLVLADRDL
jgi:DNA polymerase-3 subunit epsilon